MKLKETMKLVIMIMFCFILLGCTAEVEKSIKINLGKCLEVRVIPTSFNESPKTQVVTDRGFYILIGYFSFDKNQDVIVDEKIIRYN